MIRGVDVAYAVSTPLFLEERMTDAKEALRAAESRAMDATISPPQYTSHPSGVECIRITEHMGFCLGNAVQAIWAADFNPKDATHLKEAIWYIEREIQRRSNEAK